MYTVENLKINLFELDFDRVMKMNKMMEQIKHLTEYLVNFWVAYKIITVMVDEKELSRNKN
ncbi:hypothetical protein FACS189440_15880 [Bacteroidia bacterium]|nr:hypothetical protein FACS189423_01230 [Bacteroidia bacterium]GHT49705.1 hypothetical protein FACS189440_15880 [Bacteroidia bacterium]